MAFSKLIFLICAVAFAQDSEYLLVYGNGDANTRSADGMQDVLRGLLPIEPPGNVLWACPIEAIHGLALAQEEGRLLVHKLFAQEEDVVYDLSPLTTPVGCVADGSKVYVACFGDFMGKANTSGVAVVDISTGRVQTHAYQRPTFSHIHNVYMMQWDNKPQLFVVDLGNPWASPPTAGRGLVLFDPSTGAFDPAVTQSDLYARSAVQAGDGVFYVLEQKPAGEPTGLHRLEQSGDVLKVVSSLDLVDRDGGDGGADVFLGLDKDSLWVTDRWAGDGKLYYLQWIPQAFQFDIINRREVGLNPRYTAISDTGSIISCNQQDSTLTIFPDLANNPKGFVEHIQLPLNTSILTAPAFWIQVSR